MPGDSSNDRTKGSEPQGMVVWNRNAVVCRVGSFQDDMAAHLVHPRVMPFPAQEISQSSAGNIAREFHAT